MCYLVPFLGPIGFCRTEALGAGERRVRKNGISIFLSLPRKASESCLCCLWNGCKELEQKGSSWGQNSAQGDGGPRFSSAAGSPDVTPGIDTIYALSYVFVQGAELTLSASLTPCEQMWIWPSDNRKLL